MPTRSGLFALLSHDFVHIFGQIIGIKMKTLGNTYMVASRQEKRLTSGRHELFKCLMSNV